MAIAKKLVNHLEKNKIKHTVINHKIVYTAYDLAQTLKVKLNEIAKTLIIKADKNYVLVALSANQMLDLGKLKKLLKAKKIGIAKENVMKKIFKIKPGTITPFGSLYKLPVYCEKNLTKIKVGILGGGSYRDSVKIRISDFVKLEKPIIGIFGKKR
ncbi:MAG: YbaK/EbsC family protein [Patescibacteria group bacterium]